MTRREMLMEQYENALFALLMDEVAESEGRKAIEENERLKERGEPVISDTSRQRCIKTIARKTTQQDVKRYGRAASRVITKVAVVALVAMLLFTTAFASSENFRIKALNFVIDTFDDRTKFSLVAEDVASTQQTSGPEIYVDLILEGFVLVDEGKTDVSVWCQYVAETGATITVLFIDLTDAVWSVDTETAEMEEFKLNGIDAYMIKDDGVTQILWKLPNYPNWLCTVTGENIDAEVLGEIAKNITAK